MSESKTEAGEGRADATSPARSCERLMDVLHHAQLHVEALTHAVEKGTVGRWHLLRAEVFILAPLKQIVAEIASEPAAARIPPASGGSPHGEPLTKGPEVITMTAAKLRQIMDDAKNPPEPPKIARCDCDALVTGYHADTCPRRKDASAGGEAHREPDWTGDEPSVLGASDGLSPIPSRSEAEAAWRRLYVERMVERGIDRESAQACCDAGDVDLSEKPADAADDELQYWASDEGVADGD